MRGKVLGCLKSYLTSKSQFVALNGSMSEKFGYVLYSAPVVGPYSLSSIPPICSTLFTHIYLKFTVLLMIIIFRIQMKVCL